MNESQELVDLYEKLSEVDNDIEKIQEDIIEVKDKLIKSLQEDNNRLRKLLELFTLPIGISEFAEKLREIKGKE